MKITIRLTCPGCQSHTKVLMKKPGFLSPGIATLTCGICESKLTAKVSIPTAQELNKMVEEQSKENVEHAEYIGGPKQFFYKTQVRISWASKALIDMLEEEKKTYLPEQQVTEPTS